MAIDKVEIFSILGHNVKEVNRGFNSIHVDNLSNGFYLVKVYSNHEFTIKKLIKQ